MNARTTEEVRGNLVHGFLRNGLFEHLACPACLWPKAYRDPRSLDDLVASWNLQRRTLDFVPTVLRVWDHGVGSVHGGFVAETKALFQRLRDDPDYAPTSQLPSGETVENWLGEMTNLITRLRDPSFDPAHVPSSEVRAFWTAAFALFRVLESSSRNHPRFHLYFKRKL